MRYLIFCFLCIMAMDARGDFVLSPGVVVNGPLSSKEKTANQKVVDGDSGIGFLGNIEWMLGPFTFGLGAGYFGGMSAKVQYLNDEASASGLDASISQLQGEAFLRFRFINTKRFKWFFGGGASVGSMNMVFDQKNFEEMTGSETGFNWEESQSYNGNFIESGIEYVMTNKSALRLLARQNYLKTGEFENLGNKSLTMSHSTVGVQYLHYVDSSLFFGRR